MALVIIWILLSAWLCAAGWVLSGLHALNGTGYLTAAAVPVVLGWIFRKSWWPAGGWRRPRWQKLWRRFRRPAPLIMLTIIVLSFASGLCAPPENGDTNAYRIPRVLHWLSQSGWHWIRTDDSRQNIAGCGYEWIAAPLMLLTHGDRWFFLPNWIAYLLLPSVLFYFLRRLKVDLRVSWWWSWLLASGWCYTMQACSTNNDAFASIYALAAIAFALRGRDTGRVDYLWLSLLAASVMTAVKPTNVLLLLPCAVAVLPAWRLLLSRPLLGVGMTAFCMLASFVPTAVMNYRFTGSWKGYVPEPGPIIWWHWGSVHELPSPFSFWGLMRLVANFAYLAIQNLQPPFFPWAASWNALMQHFVQTSFGSHFSMFERFGALRRSINPATAGIGLGVLIVAVVSLAASRGRRQSPLSGSRDGHFLLRWTPWVSLTAFLSKVGTVETARLVAPFYALLFVPFLQRPGLGSLTRQSWWRWLVILVMAGTLAFMGFENGRNFIPTSILARLLTLPHRPHFLQTLDAYYQTRLSVAGYWDFTRRHSADKGVVGYSTICGGLEPGMWRPWGHARVERVLPDDTPEWVRSRGIQYVFIENSALAERRQTIDQWLTQFHAELIDQMTFTQDPGAPIAHLYFVRLLAPNEPPLTPLSREVPAGSVAPHFLKQSS